jgi:hypothetical protein
MLKARISPIDPWPSRKEGGGKFTQARLRLALSEIHWQQKKLPTSIAGSQTT